MSHNDQLGRLIEGTGQRDAIHLALAPVVASQRLKPGERITLKDPENSHELVCKADWTKKHPDLGIVDPFLHCSVEKGQRFYMVLHPNTITGLTHHWTHNAFPPVDPVFNLPLGSILETPKKRGETPKGEISEAFTEPEARQVLEILSKEIGLSVDRILNAGDYYADYEEWTYDNTEGYKDGNWDNFWEAWSVLRQKPIPDSIWGSTCPPFTCSC